MEEAKSYIAIDLKSFYASVECVDRGLDPLTTNLVVADESRTDKTICLAVSPSLKACGVPGRPRLFEVVQRVSVLNAERQRRAPGHKLTGSSYDSNVLRTEPSFALDYIVAVPRMARYIEVSTNVYNVYLKYVAPEDMHVYSIDEVFIDATLYLKTYNMSARQLAMTMIYDVLNTTGITATAGIGTNMYLCKVAMDIVAKHMSPDKNGVRIAELDEISYRRTLWEHTPITDFWRVGVGYSKRLAKMEIHTMGDIALLSMSQPGEDALFREFGVNAELLIDHAWGWEPCRISDLKAYKPENRSLCTGQVLQRPYTAEEARTVVREMTDALSLDLLDKGLVTDQLVLTLGYDSKNLQNNAAAKQYTGNITKDHYGRRIPKHAHGTGNFPAYTSSASLMVRKITELYDTIADKSLLIRRISITANHVVSEEQMKSEDTGLCEQLDFFADYEEKAGEVKMLEKERRRQKAIIAIKKKYGKNSILKGMNFEEGATMRQRNEQIGGHRA